MLTRCYKNDQVQYNELVGFWLEDLGIDRVILNKDVKG
jgi:hypothetical protein